MKVILLHEVAGLGKPGDVTDVADGYARNYLLPRQLVTPATAAGLAALREKVAAAQRKVERQRQENAALAARIEGVTLTFEVRVGRGDRLYGSVTSQDIADALVELHHLKLDRRTIQLREPLRQLGTFEVGVRIAQSMEPKLKVVIRPSGGAQVEEAAAPAAEAPEPAQE
jgi:large subunit ribosomal protein L9